jgi:hypothetical protein
MSILRRAANGASALVIAFSSVLTLIVPATTYAAGQTCTWTGAGSDANFSTVENWSDCNDAAPTDNDSLVFNVSSLSADKTVTNDIDNLILDGLTVEGTNSSGYDYVFAGDLTLNGDVTISTYMEYSGKLTLAKSISVTGDLNARGDVSNIDIAGFTLTFISGYPSIAKVTGTGSIVASDAVVYLDGAEVSTKGNSDFAGTLRAVSNGSVAVGPNSLTSSATVSIESGSSIFVCGFNGASINNALTIGGNGSGYGGIYTIGGACGGSGGAGAIGDSPMAVVPAASVNWAGPITLTADTVVNGTGEFKVTGALSGAYTLTQQSGTVGKVTVASSNNTSKTPNGTHESQLLKTTYGENKPDEAIFVGANEEAVLTGTYSQATVTGGVLKGNGILKGGLRVTKSASVAPGMSPGCLTSETLNLEGTYLFEIGGTEACTSYDQLKVLNAANTADAVTIDDTTAMLTTSFYDKFVPKKGQTYVIIEQGGDKAVKGTFKDLPEGATFTQDDVVFKISYVGGDGNDVTLTVQSVPATPDTGFALVSAHPLVSLFALLGISGLMVALARRSSKLHGKA